MAADSYMVGSEMKRLRKLHSMTQEALAEKLGVQPGHIIAVEGGNRGLSFKRVVTLCEVFNVDITEVLKTKTKDDAAYITELRKQISLGIKKLNKDDLGRVKLIVDAFNGE